MMPNEQIGKMFHPGQMQQPVNKDFYVTSVLRSNALTDLCNELTSTESLDINVEKFLGEMAENFIETVLDSACSYAKHKKSDKVFIEDLGFAVSQNFDIYEPNKYNRQINQLKASEIKGATTADHKKRMELTKEETKNVNL